MSEIVVIVVTEERVDLWICDRDQSSCKLHPAPDKVPAVALRAGALLPERRGLPRPTSPRRPIFPVSTAPVELFGAMVSTATNTPARSALPISSNTSLPSSFHLSKSLRRTLRSIKTEFRLFLAKPTRRRPWTLPLLALLVILIVSFVVFRVVSALFPTVIFREPRREETHFTHDIHPFLPRPSDFEQVRSRPCSWLYLEFGAKDGRHLDAFFENGNTFLEEFLRGTQSSMRAFCAIALEPDPAMSKLLMDVRSMRARKASHFNVFPQFVPGTHNGSESISFRNEDGDVEPEAITTRSVALKDLVNSLTYDWQHSGNDINHMNSAKGNGNKGASVVRFNILDIREAYWYLDLLEAADSDGIMCQRVDRLILNFKKIKLDASKVSADIEDRNAMRDWDKIISPPTSPMFDPKHDVAGIVNIAREVNKRPKCRTTIHVIDESGNMLVPTIISEREIFYAILAGQPTFDERVSAQTETWMTAVPHDRLTIFTNKPRDEEEMKAARGRETAVVQPHRPELEKRLPLMQSWSHLVRVRESWDRVLKNNPEIKWLALVDDDTFVFPGGMREYLSSFDHRVNIWGGSGEQARIDNGDSGVFAEWLRKLHKAHRGNHCYFENEDVPKKFKGTRIEYGVSEVLNGRRIARKVSHMCKDMFCKMGCPAVPQGAAIVLSRALVEALRPHIEECEKDTSDLCKNCGSQRLYMCANRYVGPTRTILARGICRAPWKLEHREKFPFALTFHGFNRYRGMALSTDSLHGDMVELWQLGQRYEDAVKNGHKSSYLIPMSKVADLIGCHGQGRYEKGSCLTPDGIKLQATDGRPTHDKTKPGHHPSDRKGSA